MKIEDIILIANFKLHNSIHIHILLTSKNFPKSGKAISVLKGVFVNNSFLQIKRLNISLGFTRLTRHIPITS